MKKDIEYLKIINESIIKIFEYIEGCEKNDFLNNSEKRDACLTRLMMIGEYASKLSNETKEANEEVSWNQLKAARNFYIHAYNFIDWTRIWETINIDVRQLQLSIVKVIEELEKTD